MKKNATFAAFKSQTDVDEAIRALRSEGFAHDEVSVLLPDHPGDKDFAASDNVTRVAQGAEVGGGLGFLMGGSAGLLAGLEAFRVPFLNTEFALNPLFGAVIGAMFGLLFGAGSGALVGIGTPAFAGDRYARYLEDGGIVVSVHIEDAGRRAKAMDILERCGGTDLAAVNETEAWETVHSHSLRPIRGS